MIRTQGLGIFHRARRWLPGAILLFGIALALAACGPPASPPTGEPSTATTTADAAVAGAAALTTAPAPTGAAPLTTPTAAATATPLPTDPAPQKPTLAPSPTPAPSTDTAVPTPTGLPSPEPTVPPSPTPAPAGPEITFFTVTPAEARNLGDRLHLAWQATGDRAELCPTHCFGPLSCQEVPLVGERTFVANQDSLRYNGFALRVTARGETALQAVNVRFLCHDLRTWFFDPAPPYCPAGDPSYSYAAAQHFERGFMLWVEETDEFYLFESQPDPSGTRVVHTTVGLELKPGASQDHRTGLDPPPGLYEPVSGFGLIWRGEVEWPEVGDARERLGWATEPEFGFDTATQDAILPCPRGWALYLRGPRGQILRLAPASTVGWPLLWEQVSP
jgi:hypothetical protein